MQHKNSFSQGARPVYIVDGVRTPFLKMRAVPGPFSASDLAVSAAKALLERMPFAASMFDEVVVGCVMPSPEEANIARLIALRAGCGKDMPAWTVQRNCASGLQAIDSALQSIREGRSELVLAGGCEAMSRAPLLWQSSMVRWLGELRQAKGIARKGQFLLQFRPHFLAPVIALLKGLTDPVINLSMGQTAEELAYRFGISRGEMDAFSVESHKRVVAGMAAGCFEEIAPLYAMDGAVYLQDDGVRADATVEKLGQLKPAFEKYGNITAGNSSQISDGAAMLVLASEQAVLKYNLPVLAKIMDIHWGAVDPIAMGLGPIHAMTPLLKKYQLSLADIDHIEMNEAFAAQVLACSKAWADPIYCQQELGLSSPLGEINFDCLNPQGGAIAIGHPVGASGARLVLHCAKMLAKNKKRHALASLCIGGGQGGAILLDQADGI